MSDENGNEVELEPGEVAEVEITEIDTSGDVVVVYPAEDGARWYRMAANGRKTAESGEAYTRKADAIEAAERNNEGVKVVVSERWADLPDDAA